MASWTRRETITRRVEYVVPAAPPYGATWVEVAKAVSAARAEIGAAAGAYDDAVWIRPGEDELLVVIPDTPTQPVKRATEVHPPCPHGNDLASECVDGCRP